jgi:bacteriocin biosynthesis cyclodehydratase domain-containing protein
MHLKNIRFIRVSANKAVLKRGVSEVLLEAADVSSVVEHILQLVNAGVENINDLLTQFPGPRRLEVAAIVEELVRRGFFDAEDDDFSDASAENELKNFFSNFGSHGLEAPSKLRNAGVLIVGWNRISSALASALEELEIGKVTVVGHPILGTWSDGMRTPYSPSLKSTELHPSSKFLHVDEFPPEAEIAENSLICATSEIGEADSLMEVNRVALKLWQPYLPIWISDLVSFVGPLNHPFETPCFNCFRLRRDATDPNFKVSRQVRKLLSSQANAHPGLLPSIPRILGEIAALEVAKTITSFAPPDASGHVIELNLISLQLAVRRVLKIPRCPECSDFVFRSAKAITKGPVIPAPEETASQSI